MKRHSTLTAALAGTYVVLFMVLTVPGRHISAVNTPPTHNSADTVATTTEVSAEVQVPLSASEETPDAEETLIPKVPFYSQFNDITPPEWKKLSCGIASLAMLIDHYGEAVAPDTLLKEGVVAGAYITDAGWSHDGLIGLAKDHGLTGRRVGLADRSMSDAFAALEEAVAAGPVMVSVHYTFDPQNPIPHLVVVTGIDGSLVHYNDPAEEKGGGSVSIKQFQSAWKQRYIEIRPG